MAGGEAADIERVRPFIAPLAQRTRGLNRDLAVAGILVIQREGSGVVAKMRGSLFGFEFAV